MENSTETKKTAEEELKNITSKEYFKKINIKEKFIQLKEIITIEPLVCLLVLAKMMSGPALTNLHFEKACKVNAGFNDSVCDAIVFGTYREKNFTDQNNVVQSFLTQMRSWEVPVSSVIPVIIILFVGAYSDRHKIRKPFLLMPLIGDMVAILGSVINVFYMYEWSLEVQIAADKVIPSLFGSEKLMMTVGLAYIADISTPEMRIIRFTTIPIILTVLVPIFQAISGILFRQLGYLPIFGISLTLFIIAFIYGIFMVKEPQKLKEDRKYLIKDIFNVKHVTDTFKLLVEKKDNTDRTTFLALLFIAFLHAMVLTGEMSAFFMFVQQAYQWTVVDYSYFTTASTVVKFIGLSVVVPIFAKVFKFNDITIMIIAYLDSILSSSIFVLVQSSVGLYIGRVFSVFVAPGHQAQRSLLTKVISPDDIAKSVSLCTIVGAIAAALAAQIYHQGIYEHTRKTFPQAFLLFGVGIHIIEVLILIGLYWREKRQKNIIDKPGPATVLDTQIIEEAEI